MDDLFAPPGNDWRPVSPQLARMRRTVLAVLVARRGGVACAAGLDCLGLLGWFGALAALWLVLGAAGWVVIGRNARSWGYAERDEDLFIKHGALFRELVAVPYGRMQFVDVTSGPLEQPTGSPPCTCTPPAPHDARIPGLAGRGGGPAPRPAHLRSGRRRRPGL